MLKRFDPFIGIGARWQCAPLPVSFDQFLLITQASRAAVLRQKLGALIEVLVLLRESVEVVRAHEAALAGEIE